MAIFPLPADATYSYADRYGEGPTDHHGTDIFAAEGTPVVAVTDGIAAPRTDPKGGNVVYLRSESGSVDYYYAHLRDVADLGTADYTIVHQGDVIGHVGSTGNAAGTPPHLHYQIKAAGRLVNPYPFLVVDDPNRATSTAPPRTFPYPRKPTADSIPPKGRWTKPGGVAVEHAESRTAGMWTLALLIGAVLVWRQFAGNGGNRA